MLHLSHSLSKRKDDYQVPTPCLLRGPRSVLDGVDEVPIEVGEVLVERVVAPEKKDVVTVVDELVDERPVALFEKLLEEGVVLFRFEERKVADEDLGEDREISRLALPGPRVEVSLQRTVESGVILFDVAAEFGVVGAKMDEKDALRRADVEEGESYSGGRSVTAEADPAVVKGVEAHVMHSSGVMEIREERWRDGGRVAGGDERLEGGTE